MGGGSDCCQWSPAQVQNNGGVLLPPVRVRSGDLRQPGWVTAWQPSPVRPWTLKDCRRSLSAVQGPSSLCPIGVEARIAASIVSTVSARAATGLRLLGGVAVAGEVGVLGFPGQEVVAGPEEVVGGGRRRGAGQFGPGVGSRATGQAPGRVLGVRVRAAGRPWSRVRDHGAAHRPARVGLPIALG
jgi:hypothetical protein